jgi:hypothetical protein
MHAAATKTMLDTQAAATKTMLDTQAAATKTMLDAQAAAQAAATKAMLDAHAVTLMAEIRLFFMNQSTVMLPSPLTFGDVTVGGMDGWGYNQAFSNPCPWRATRALRAGGASLHFEARAAAERQLRVPGTSTART